MFLRTIILATLALFSSSIYPSDWGYSSIDIRIGRFSMDKKPNTMHLRKTIEPYLDGKQPCPSHLEKTNNPRTSIIVSSLFSYFFDAESAPNQFRYDGDFLHIFIGCPAVLNKALFTLKVPPCKKKLNIVFLSKELKQTWYIDPLEKEKLDVLDTTQWYFINENFFRHIYGDEAYLKSMRRASKEEKCSYWQTSLKPTFYPEFINQNIRKNAQLLLLTLHRLKKEKKITIDKRLLFTNILPLLFEEEFNDFKSHCTIVELTLNEQIVLEEIEDPKQKPFFQNFKDYYTTYKEICFENLYTYETIREILKYRFFEKK